MSKDVREFKLEKPQSIKESKCPIFYGKCEETSNVENDLWFITLDRFFWEKIWDTGWNKPFPFEHHTFLVEEEYATPLYMNQFRTDVMKWSQVAKKIFVGSWCERYEILWKDVPVYVYQGDPNIKYGYCSTQSRKHPNRELWFVSLNNGSTFVVDKICISDDFIKRMGRDINKWMTICWCHLEHEVIWEDLQTGTLDGGYVRSIRGFALDSPYIPSSIEEIEIRIRKYELEKEKKI